MAGGTITTRMRNDTLSYFIFLGGGLLALIFGIVLTRQQKLGGIFLILLSVLLLTTGVFVLYGPVVYQPYTTSSLPPSGLVIAKSLPGHRLATTSMRAGRPV